MDEENLENGDMLENQTHILREFTFVRNEMRTKEFPCVATMKLLTVINGATMAEFTPAWIQENMCPLMFEAAY